jgi:hypothetical protein
MCGPHASANVSSAVTEAEALAKIRLRLGEYPDVRLFRNQVGEAWTGEWVSLADGSILIRHPRRITTGLAPGSADLVGWTVREIQKHWVGKRMAIFSSIEVKSKTGRVRPEQQAWHEKLVLDGALSGFARTPEEALDVVYPERLFFREIPDE